MKFCLISGKQGEDVKPIFIESAKKHFDTVLAAPLERLTLICEDGKTKVMYKGQDLTTFDAVYLRAFNDDFLFAEVVLDALESAGVYMPSTLDGYQVTNHKFFSIERTARIGVPVPDTSLAVTPQSALALSERFGYPIVLKLLRGFGGKGVMLLQSEAELRPVLDTLQVFNEFPSAQEFIPSKGEDIRALVIGDEVIGIRRKGSGTEWRANVSAGGKPEIVKLDADITNMAREISKVLGLDICGIDFIMSKEGPHFIEANFTPGIMAKYFDATLAEKMLAYIAKRAS